MEKEDFDVEELRLKAARLRTDLAKCMCHIGPKDSGDLNPFNDHNWEIFRPAAEVRQDETFDILYGFWESSPQGGYYHRCYLACSSWPKICRLVNKRLDSEKVESPGVSGPLPGLKALSFAVSSSVVPSPTVRRSSRSLVPYTSLQEVHPVPEGNGSNLDMSWNCSLL